MLKKKTVLSFLLIIAMVFGVAITAFADGQISTGEITITPNTNPYEYGTAPDNLYVFLYHGYNPYFTGDFDTSECVLDHLYVHNQITNEIVEITNQPVNAYTATKDALYYITEDLTIYKTDYTGSNHTALYQSEGECIRDLSTYLEVLVLIEGEDNVVFVDSNTGEASVVLTLDGLDWIFMLDDTEMLVVTLTEEYLIYNLPLREFTDSISEIDANSLVNIAVLGASGISEPNASIMSTIPAPPTTIENDIAFPLDEYDANIYSPSYVQNFGHRKPLSWFHKNDGEGCNLVEEIPPDDNNPYDNCRRYAGTGQCEGFARYAHDAYLHIIDDTIAYHTWKSTKHPVDTDYQFDEDVVVVKTFFEGLNTGAYVRYGRENDTTPPEGVHSITFVSADETGIWVYECNQSYYKRLTEEEIAGRPESYFGCGVHFQYYTYAKIADQYDFVAHYINHSFTGTSTCRNITTHKLKCAHCNGYVVQSHTTSGRGESYSDTMHKLIYPCCDGFILQAHKYPNGSRMCSMCGWITGMVIAKNNVSVIRE